MVIYNSNLDRGPVLECIVSRTLRNIEHTQNPVRLVGQVDQVNLAFVLFLFVVLVFWLLFW